MTGAAYIRVLDTNRAAGSFQQDFAPRRALIRVDRPHPAAQSSSIATAADGLREYQFHACTTPCRDHSGRAFLRPFPAGQQGQNGDISRRATFHCAAAETQAGCGDTRFLPFERSCSSSHPASDRRGVFLSGGGVLNPHAARDQSFTQQLADSFAFRVDHFLVSPLLQDLTKFRVNDEIDPFGRLACVAHVSPPIACNLSRLFRIIKRLAFSHSAAYYHVQQQHSERVA